METIVLFRPPSTEIKRCMGEEERGLRVLTGNVVRFRHSSNLSCVLRSSAGKRTHSVFTHSGLGYREYLGHTISRGRKTREGRSVIMKKGILTKFQGSLKDV